MNPDRPTAGRMLLTLAGLVVTVVALGAGFALALMFISPTTTEPPGRTVDASEPVSTPATNPSAVSTTESGAPSARVADLGNPSSETSDAARRRSALEKSVVVIDAGHQARGNSSLEPVGPGSSTRKARVTTGSTGVSTHTPESLINLRTALKLRDQLRRRGVTVIMVRTAQDVDISNSERAAAANKANADLFVRLHCNGSENRSTAGLSTLVPASNHWTAPIVKPSKKAGRLVHRATLSATGARDLGVVTRSDLSGFNWAKVPTVLLEMGFLSNAAEDRKLNSAAYQDKLVTGMADGICAYLESK